jgi:hypothetical protein
VLIRFLAAGLPGFLAAAVVAWLVLPAAAWVVLDAVLAGAADGALDAAADPLGAVPSLPDAALLAFEVPTAWCALLMSDWNCPRAGLDVPLPPLFEPGLSAKSHSAKNATVPMSRAISEREAGIASLIIGSWPDWHEPSRAY